MIFPTEICEGDKNDQEPGLWLSSGSTWSDEAWGGAVEGEEVRLYNEEVRGGCVLVIC